MAPLGILTAIVAAIRVGGPSWLRVVIGRARENRASVEVELMSSTSHEVCELWNGQGIVRTIGRPEIQQIQKTLPHTIPTSTDSTRRTVQQQISAPNISLNLHGGSKTHELYLVALCGIFLQFGMFVFCGLTVYHPSLKSQFLKNSRLVRPYAYPTMATGTLLLIAGMIICSVIVEQSTEEKQWGAGEKHPGGGHQKLNARILWLQKKHVVSDQSFDSCVIFGKDRRDFLLSSRRSQPEKKWKTWPLVASNASEALTLLGGLRGMNWTASIAQLVCIFLMTVLRALIRRGLIVTPICKNAHDRHEMDWLALRIAREYDGKSSHITSHGDQFWPKDDKEFEPDEQPDCADDEINRGFYRNGSNDEGQTRERLGWRIFTADETNYATVGDLGLKIGKAQHALRVRQRLGNLTKWTG
ncbi:hypothetical protein K440DRAFT_583372, partial [Wilcoxina mikolae CBS 423.85]